MDNSWITVFARPDLREAGVHIVVDPPGWPGHTSIYLLRLGEGLTIAVPAAIADEIAAATEGRAPDELFDPDEAARLGGERTTLVLGPSRHHYTDVAGFVRPEACDARRITEQEAEPLRRSIPEVDWSEGGFGRNFPDVAYGCFDDGRLVAAGHMTEFAGKPADVGLVTHPDARGKGYGTRLAGAMTADAFDGGVAVVRYRALFTNTASLKVAARLGFVADGANIAVRLRQT